MNTLKLSAEILIQINSVVSEIRPEKVKSRGRIYLSRRIYSAKYGMYMHWLFAHVKLDLPLPKGENLSLFHKQRLQKTFRG